MIKTLKNSGICLENLVTKPSKKPAAKKNGAVLINILKPEENAFLKESMRE